MAMSDTEMALALGANQLAAMRPVDPGAFSGIQPNMAPPMPNPMPSGAMSDQEAMMMRGSMPASPMPNPMGSISDQEAAMMRAAMPSGDMPAPDLNSQEGMMRYLQEKVRQIRERTGGGAMSDADMGALDAVMKSMPQGNQPMQRPAPMMPQAGPPMGAQR
jgi:hypothetical protein